MAVIKRENKKGVTYQVKLRGNDGKWVTTSFLKKSDATKYEQKMSLKKSERLLVTSSQKITVNQFWDKLCKESFITVTEGWHESQKQMFRDHISPVIGNELVSEVLPKDVSSVFNEASKKKLSAQTLVHIYNLLHKIFEQAISLYQLISSNPVLKELKVKIPEKETANLDFDESIKLLSYVKGKEFGLAIWTGILCGLRVGEKEALPWTNVDLKTGFIHVRATYDRKTNTIKDYPKGKRWFSVQMPYELWEYMKEAKKQATSEFVFSIPENAPYKNFYDAYMWRLRKYCKECGVTKIATHGLRHSTASIYLEYGATDKDMQNLFSHASMTTTKRYIHSKARDKSRMGRITNSIQLFANNLSCS